MALNREALGLRHEEMYKFRTSYGTIVFTEEYDVDIKIRSHGTLEWHKWWAWYPVRIAPDRLRWLDWTARRWTMKTSIRGNDFTKFAYEYVAWEEHAACEMEAARKSNHASDAQTPGASFSQQVGRMHRNGPAPNVAVAKLLAEWDE